MPGSALSRRRFGVVVPASSVVDLGEEARADRERCERAPCASTRHRPWRTGPTRVAWWSAPPGAASEGGRARMMISESHADSNGPPDGDCLQVRCWSRDSSPVIADIVTPRASRHRQTGDAAGGATRTGKVVHARADPDEGAGQPAADRRDRRPARRPRRRAGGAAGRGCDRRRRHVDRRRARRRSDRRHPRSRRRRVEDPRAARHGSTVDAQGRGRRGRHACSATTS